MRQSYTPRDIEQLRREVHQRVSSYDASSRQWQRGIQEKHKRRIDEIIIEVVRDYYGRIVQEAVRQLRRLFSLK